MALYVRHFHDIDSELDLMHEYVLEVTLSLTTAKKDLYKRFTESVAGLPQEKAQELAADSYLRDLFLSEHFPALHTNWTFVAIMSFVEHQMVRICKALQEQDKASLGVDDMNGQGLEVCNVYLRKVYGMDISSIAEWTEIKQRQKVRNIIVHRLGNLEEKGQGKQKGKDDQIYKFFEGRSDVKLDRERGFAVTHEFCFEAIEIARRFLRKVTEQIPERFFERMKRER